MKMKLFPNYGYVVVVNFEFLSIKHAKPVGACRDKQKNEVYMIYEDDEGSYYAYKN